MCACETITQKKKTAYHSKIFIRAIHLKYPSLEKLFIPISNWMIILSVHLYWTSSFDHTDIIIEFQRNKDMNS